MARTSSKNAIKTIDSKLNSKKTTKKKNNLKEVKKSTTLKDKTVESIIKDLDNISVPKKTSLKEVPKASSTTRKSSTVSKSVSKPKTSTTTGSVTKTGTTKKSTTTTKKTTTSKTSGTKKSTKSTTTKKSSTTGTKGRKKNDVDKFQVVDNIISDLDNTDKFKFDENGIDDVKKEVITSEFDEDILADKKFDVIDDIIDTPVVENNIDQNIIDNKIEDDKSVKEETTIAQEEVTLVKETTPKRRSRRRANRFDMIEDPLDDKIVDSSSKEELLDNLDRESNDEIVSSFEEDLGIKSNKKDDKYDNLEGDLRSLYDIGNDVVEDFHKNKKETKPRFVKEKKIKKRIDVSNKNVESDEVGYIKPSLLDYISQRALNFFLTFFFVVFMLMCIGVVIFIIYVSTF